MKKMIKKFFIPNKTVGFVLFNLGFFLLIYVFSLHLEGKPIAYVAYALSAYALSIFCVWFYKACKFTNDFIKEKSRIYKICENHHRELIKLSMASSLAINLVYAIFKFYMGIAYKSMWFITFAVYYSMLSIMKSSLLRGVKKERPRENLIDESKKLRMTGLILLFLDLVLFGMIILIIRQNRSVSYPGYLIYIVALYDFYLVISASINVFKYHKKDSPILLASKCINLSVALISMISLEVAMIYEFGDGASHFKHMMTASTGLGVVLINTFMSIYMIVKSNRYLNQKND